MIAELSCGAYLEPGDFVVADGWGGVIDIFDNEQCIDPGTRGADPAGRDGVFDFGRSTGKHRLDSSCSPVANPAFEAATNRLDLDERPEADALHAPFDE